MMAGTAAVSEKRRGLNRPGHPFVYCNQWGKWCSVVWTRDPSGELVVAQACTNHPTWRMALGRVERWYRDGRC